MIRFDHSSDLTRLLLRYSKGVLIAINVFLLAFGLTMLGCSVWVLDEARGFVMNTFYSTSAILLALSGLYCVVLGVIGCLGSQERAKVPLLLFIWGLSGVFLLLLVTQVLAFLFAADIGSSFRSLLYQSARLYFNSTLVQDSWDVLQSRLKCCGTTKADQERTVEPFSVWQTTAEFR